MGLKFDNQVALITGAGQGVGRRIAMALAEEGCTVCVNDLFEDRARGVAGEIVVAGGRAMHFAADVRNFPQVSAMFDAVRSSFGAPQILVNNAGIPPRLREPGAERPLFVDSTPEQYEEVVSLNLTGTMNCCLLALKDMRANSYGRIINIISEAARVGESRLAAYSGAKAGILGLSMALAREHGQDRITVNAVALGAVSHEGIKTGPLRADATPETDEKLARMVQKYPAGHGLGRVGRPEDVAAAVVYFASRQAEFVTGQCLGVSGGFYMG